MGREIRKVPPHHEHPKKDGEYIPLHDEKIDMPAWLAEFDRVRSGNLTADEKQWYPNGLQDWLQDEGRPPDPKSHRTEPH